MMIELSIEEIEALYNSVDFMGKFYNESDIKQSADSAQNKLLDAMSDISVCINDQ